MNEPTFSIPPDPEPLPKQWQFIIDEARIRNAIEWGEELPIKDNL